jgi:hypothetical protein
MPPPVLLLLLRAAPLAAPVWLPSAPLPLWRACLLQWLLTWQLLLMPLLQPHAPAAPRHMARQINLGCMDMGVFADTLTCTLAGKSRDTDMAHHNTM